MTDIALLDVNVLLALAQQSHVHHEPARRWLGARRPGSFWATCPTTEIGLLRLMTNPKVVKIEHRPADVLALLDALRTIPGHRFLADMTSLSNSRLDLGALVGSKQVTDFHLVNLAASSKAVLATFDRRLHDGLVAADRGFVELIPA